MEPTDPIQPEHELSAGERFSQDLDEINSAIIEMLMDENADASNLQQAWLVRAILTEDFVDSLVPSLDNPNPRPRVQFDIMVDTAIIFETAGDIVRYLEELDAAEAFALNNHLEDVAESVGRELDEKIKKIGTSPEELILKLRGKIEFSNRDYLRRLLADGINYDDLIGNVYRMILKEGGDPDATLAELGVTE